QLDVAFGVDHAAGNGLVRIRVAGNLLDAQHARRFRRSGTRLPTHGPRARRLRGEAAIEVGRVVVAEGSSQANRSKTTEPASDLVVEVGLRLRPSLTRPQIDEHTVG